MRVPFLILFVSQLFFHSYTIAQKISFKQNQNINKVESLHDRGNSGEATLLLNKLIKSGLIATDEAQLKILSAKSLHENGKRVEAIVLLQGLLTSSFIQTPQNINLRVEAYLVLAECYFGMYWQEKFKNVSDTVLQLSRSFNLAAHYRARAFTNLARYYNYQVLGQNAKPYLDTAVYLLKKAPLGEKKLYHPLAILTAQINYYRNADIKLLYQIIDSVKALLYNGGQYEKYGQIYLWRAIGNAYFDRARLPDKLKNRPWYNDVIYSFEKARVILKRDYPENKIDLVYINNLEGLMHFYAGYFERAQKQYNASAEILSDNQVSREYFSYAYLNTYLWQLKNIDSLYNGDKLFQIKKQQLTKWQELTVYWTKWENANQTEKLHYFRDIYAVNPYSMIVLLCYDLYQYKKETGYINIALKAQENNKSYFLKNSMIKRYNLTEPADPSVKDIQLKLLPDQAVISFSDVMSYIRCSYAIVITTNTAAIIKIENDRSFYGRGDVKLSDSICKDLSSFKSKSYEGYNIFFKPVQHLLNKKVNHLLILPSTFSAYFNFEMMVSDTVGFNTFGKLPYLSDQFRFTYEFSWQVAELRKQIVTKKQNNAINRQAYIPDYSNTRFYQLPFFNRTAGVLQNKFGFTSFNNKSATLYNYEANAGSAGILHIAGHCYSSDRSAEDLHIAMDSAKKGALNYLDAENIIRIPLSADLTVLSLCETGIGEAFVNGSYLNMAYWFTYAGSKSCLYSYWKLDDRSTAYILERFYHYLAKGMKKSEALREAKKDYLVQTKTDEERNPIYWGGLTVIGDDSPVNITESKKGSYWYFVLLLAIPAIIYLLKRRKKD